MRRDIIGRRWSRTGAGFRNPVFGPYFRDPDDPIRMTVQDKLAEEMNGGSRPPTATAALLAQVIEAAIITLYWFAWSFGFGKLPSSLFLSSAIFGLPLALSMAAARGLHLGREWAWWLSFLMNIAVAVGLLAIGYVAVAALPLVLSTLLLLPMSRRYYFTFRQ